MEKEHFYEVNVQWKEGRVGELSSPVLKENIEVATPPEFAQGVAGVWSPEHLYAAAINACYMTTFLAIAENSRLEYNDFSCKTVCKMEQVEGRFLMTKAEVTPTVELVNPEKDGEKLVRILEKSKKACLISNSMKTEVTLNL